MYDDSEDILGTPAGGRDAMKAAKKPSKAKTIKPAKKDDGKNAKKAKKDDSKPAKKAKKDDSKPAKKAKKDDSKPAKKAKIERGETGETRATVLAAAKKCRKPTPISDLAESTGLSHRIVRTHLRKIVVDKTTGVKWEKEGTQFYVQTR